MKKIYTIPAILLAVIILILANRTMTSNDELTRFYEDKGYVEGEIIVAFKKTTDPVEFAANHDAIGLRLKEVLIKDMNIYLFSYDVNRSTSVDALMSVMRSDDVMIAQFNHTFKERVVPNDTRFAEQWDKHNTGQSGGTVDADIDAPEAWNISTGGLTVQGDTIVVAIVDGGQQVSHTDLNTWRNWAEIPGNGVDDDGNGYIDDINGWNAGSNNGTISPNLHGTHCAGIAGAKGNNSLGVAGVNWGVKTMPIMYGSATEANAVKAYGYAYVQRKRYNQSNGTQGAFVVSTNSSWGIDFGNPANYPLWCAFYDSLGRVGILSAGAGPNLNIDIDTQGDMPTTCPSNFMIAVTNTTRTDAKNSGAGYGPINMDLGAPGTSILSTVPTNTYSTLTGTSMATPQVAGAVGLIYAGARNSLIQLAKNDPDSAALLFKQYIMTSVDTISSMVNTVSKGRLNIHKMLQKVVPLPTSLLLTFSIEAMWNGTAHVQDTLRVRLRSATSPFGLVDSGKVVLDPIGYAVCSFTNVSTGNYYIQTIHRNGLEVWSSTPRSLTEGGASSYDFTTSQSQTFGNNSVLKGSRYCTYSGDVQGDGAIDLSDINQIFNDASAFVTGYVRTDVNGDNIADLSDILVTYNNSNDFVVVIRP